MLHRRRLCVRSFLLASVLCTLGTLGTDMASHAHRVVTYVCKYSSHAYNYDLIKY